ncbi:MAG: fused MFS/spermidine synthase [Bacteroidetes bacterium]|nr:fused MFS/spermidine synthase [Bacteroidota bacterium]
MPLFLFYFLSFLEGASVMAAELLGAKMLAPYFGSSLYVWASVLGITLGGLAMGYFAGGVFSQKKNNEKNLYAVLLASAIFLILMPLTAKEIMLHTAGFSLLASILISSFIFLFPPVFFMGMVSPMIVQCIAHPVPPEGREKDTQDSPLRGAGGLAGTVYAISTLGGIISTFLLGFYLIPNFGLTKPAIVMGIILGIIPFVKLITAKNFFSLIFLFAVFFSFRASPSPSERDGVRLLYSSEGLLGQIIVADYPLASTPSLLLQEKGVRDEVGYQRILFVNRSTQTIVTYKKGEKSFFEYVDLISEKTKNSVRRTPCGEGGIQKTEEKKALVLGLGGGSIANKLSENGFQVDAVELDERMADCAKKFFDLNKNVKVNIDDARHYVRWMMDNGQWLMEQHQPSTINHQPLYSVVVLDAFIGEVNPHHLFTTEFFSEIKSLLSDSGTFFINGNGFWNGEEGKGMRSVCKTLINSGFDVELIPTSEQEDYRNLLFVAKPISNLSQREGSLHLQVPSLGGDLGEAVILTDEKPQLEILNAEANRQWREACMKYFLSGYYSGQDKLLFK